MRIFRDISDLPKFKNAVITIGSFDGMHRGHQKLIKRINHLAKEVDGESVIITFDPHPRSIIYPKDKSLDLLNTLDEKIDLCETFDIDNLVIVPFSVEFSQQHPREYVENFLLRSFDPAYVVIGYDHRFGLNREGNIDLLQEYARERGFEVIQIKKQELEDITISSTKIRNALKVGDIDVANQFLNHSYQISGEVVAGDQIGNTIGYPTANIEVEERTKLIPADGVYAVRCEIEGLEKTGMMYIGVRPSIDKPTKERKIEVHIFDFDQNIYGKHLEVTIEARIRGDMKFESLDALKLQLKQDQSDVEDYFSIEPTTAEEQDNVCIAILNYNGEEYLESYLPQVLYSSADPINVCVIDNNSTDESVSYVQDWHPEMQLVQLQKNFGFAEGYNRGLKYVDAKYTVILNSDVLVTTNWLDPILRDMEANPDIAIVQPKILSLEERTKFEYAGASGGFLDTLGYPYCRGRIFDTVEADRGQYDEMIDVDWASGAAMVVRTEVFKNLGGFDADFFAHMEEIDFCIRASKCGYQIKVQPQSVIYHLGGGTLDYASARKVQLNFRNSLYTMVKNMRVGELMWKLPARLILDGMAALKYLLDGKWSSILAIFKAHWEFFMTLPSAWKKRKTIAEITTKYHTGKTLPKRSRPTSIVWQYYALGRRTYDRIKK